MPYIDPQDRDITMLDTAGELNFEITKLVIRYLRHHGLQYKTCNDIVGALENAKHEFQRRVQDPYEDTKIQENGDVYPEEFVT